MKLYNIYTWSLITTDTKTVTTDIEVTMAYWTAPFLMNLNEHQGMTGVIFRTFLNVTTCRFNVCSTWLTHNLFTVAKFLGCNYVFLLLILCHISIFYLEKLGVESSLVQNAVEGLMYVLLEASKRSVCFLIHHNNL